MNKLLALIFCFCAFPLFAQEADKISEFHRLLIFNSQNKLMVVKIKNTDYWVTPGIYSKTKVGINGDLHKLAAEYGLTVSQPDLRGIFTLKNKQTSIELKRHFFNVNVIDGEVNTPDNIEEIKWLSIDDAVKTITFPHINLLIKQVMTYPENIWGGTVLRYKDQGKFKAQMISDFMPLNLPLNNTNNTNNTNKT